MKLLIFLAIFGFSNPKTQVDRIPQSDRDYSQCDAREVAKGIQSDTRLPRSSLFHFGKKEILMKDIAQGNIPENDWNDFIMGEKTRFKLKPFRRGFYGTEYVEDADHFGDSTYNWLVEVKLKKECLVASKVASLVYLPKNPDFKKWYPSKNYPATFDQWKLKCFDSDLYPRYGAFVNYKNPNEKADFSENDCEKTVADYYDDRRFAFVQDYAGDLVRSWAIRDRNCIETIKGSEAYWVKNFTTRSEFWENTCRSDRDHRNNTRVFFAAISHVGVKAEEVEKLTTILKALKEPTVHTDWETDEEDRFVAQDFISELASAVKRCGLEGKGLLQDELGKIARNVSSLQSLEVKEKMEQLCR